METNKIIYTIDQNRRNDIRLLADKNLLLFSKYEVINEPQLLNELKKYNLIDALEAISTVYRYMLNKNHDEFRTFLCEVEDTGLFLRSDMLAKLAHFILKSKANKYREKKLSNNLYPNILYLTSVISNLLETKIPINKETILNHMCILAIEQINLQKDIKSFTCRNYYIFKSFEKNFISITKMTLKEYFNTCLLLLIYLNKNKILFEIDDIFAILSENELPYCTKENIEKVIKHLSINLSDYKDLLNKKQYENIMPIQDKPILKLTLHNKETYIVPSPPYFLEKVYNGIFYDIEKTYNNTNDFRQELGLIFEQYVGEIIKCYLSNMELKSENDIQYIKNGKDAKFVDWTVLEQDTAYLIEVKSAVMPLHAIYNTTPTDFIKMHIISAYKQIINKLLDINYVSELNFLQSKNIKPIIIFRDIPFLSNGLYLSKIQETVKEYINEHQEDSYILEYIQNNKIYLFNIEDFELFWANKSITSIDNLFENIGNEHSIKSFLQSLTTNLEEHMIFEKIFQEIFDKNN